MAQIDQQQPQSVRELAEAAKEAVAEQKAANLRKKTGVADAAAESAPSAVAQAQLAVRKSLINGKDPHALERLIGQRDIVSVNFLQRGLNAAKAVCRIKTLAAGGGLPDYATGFLATPNLLVTNNHVLPDPETASRSLAEFDYEFDVNFVERRGRIFPLVPLEAFYTSVELDFTVVAISPMGHDGTPVTDFGVLPLIPMSGKGLPGEYVSIIQHPGGQTKQVVMRENQIVQLDKTKFPNVHPAFIHYFADTEPGSSGSPVFNDQWDLVAIHHLALVDTDEAGRPLNKRGEVWTEADGQGQKKWIANEGLRVSELWKHLQSAARFSDDAGKIMAMLVYEPRSQLTLKAVDAGPPKKWQTLPNIGEAPAFEATRFRERAFAASTGYDPRFLGDDLQIPLPKTSRSFRGTLAKNEDTGKTLFDYTHFSLAIHAERRLAAWTAVNISGKDLKTPATEPSWRRDRRLPANQQTLADVYGKVPGKGVQIDRGHLVRRLDPVWGDQRVADRAAVDTFHFTNAAPQEHVFNGETWGNLEDFVLARAEQRDHKVTVMTGPVLRPDDKFYGEGLRGGPWQIARSFWKIAIFKRPDGSVSATGFIMEQSSTIAPLFERTRFNPYTVDEAKVFQRKISMIEELTGLDFGKLRTLDRMGSVESTSAEAARPIRGAEDIAF